ncbi:MFS transporter [Arsenicicoccus dermatophilus]|uniref:MFS transporter n=1 Tax=Arsenicicoccus dermatophilus TaxID=1076331 RepID=UPI001F4CFEA0|nr:MFS transporter [Arsenicicoccus dermatophilus]
MLTAAVHRYREVLAVPATRDVTVIGTLVRLPIFAAGLALTFHAVLTLHVSWFQAGLLTTATTLAGAVSSPMRGRLLDTRGLRRTLLPCVVVGAVCWSVAPFVGYWTLLALAVLAGLFQVPVFSIVRQGIVATTPRDLRQTALALDAVLVELAFMVGPVVGTWLATTQSTRWTVLGLQWSCLLAVVALMVWDPPLVDEETTGQGHVPRRQWFTPGFVVILLASSATTMTLSGTDVAIIAMLRAWGQTPATGWVMASWGLGSLVGGLVYGGLRRTVPVLGMLGALALVTIPAAWATGVPSLAVLVTAAGLLCAPTITASSHSLAEGVPGQALGEAMGWHGSAMTLGSALGAPLAGLVMDRAGPGAGFLTVGLLSLLVAVLGSLAVRGRRARSAAQAAA